MENKFLKLYIAILVIGFLAVSFQQISFNAFLWSGNARTAFGVFWSFITVIGISAYLHSQEQKIK